MKIRIHRILKETIVEGPGIRYCIWVQGCSRHCNGCMAQNTWDKNAGHIIDTEEIVNDIKKQKIEGITFLGGEPFEQPKEVLEIIKNIRKTGISVMVFTGFTLQELKNKNNQYINQILDNIDILIDGPFVEELKDFSRPWVGSLNQKYHFLTDRYNDDIYKIKNKVEVRIDKQGTCLINGMGDFNKINNIL